MKLFIHFLYIACLFLAALPAHAEDEEFEPKTAAHYLESGVTIVLPDDWKPFSFINEAGERDGYLPQLWRAWGEHTSLQYRIEYMEEASGLEALKNKEVDILGGLRHEPVLEESMTFADSLHSTTSVLAIRTDSPVDCSTALYETPVGLVDGTRVHAAFAGKYPDSEIMPFPSAESAAAALLDGTVHAVAVEYTPLIQTARHRDKAEVLQICRTVHYDEIYAAIQKDEEELLELVSEGFNAIPQEQWERIQGNWFEKREARTFDWRGQIVPAVGALLFVAVAVVMWVRRRR